jgi:hypothetical protein
MRAWIIGLAALAAASSAWAADWTTYAHPELGFTIESPVPPASKTTSTKTAGGAVQTTIFAIDEGQAGAIVLAVDDYRGVKLSPEDIRKGLEAAVQRPLTKMNATLLSETPITVDGFPGREISARADPAGLLIKGRVVFAGQRLYQLLAVGPAATGIPSDFERLEASFKVNRPVVPTAHAGDLR